MSVYVEGSDRRQTLFLPDVLDDYVDEENEVRFIDAFVDTLDLIELGFTHSELLLARFEPVEFRNAEVSQVR